jgi:hypothetical protein
MTMLVLFIALFPVMSALHAQASNELYHVLAGVLLGGIAALSHALLHDGFVRWRQAGLAGIERSHSLRALLLGLVYPVLGLVSGVIALIGTGPNVGLHYAIGFAAGGGGDGVARQGGPGAQASAASLMTAIGNGSDQRDPGRVRAA